MPVSLRWAVVGVLAVVGLGCILIGAAALARRSRANEIAADQIASAHGHPVTDHVAAWITAAELQLPRRAYGLWRTHPMGADRQHHTDGDGD